MSAESTGRRFTDHHRVGAADVAADGGAHVFAVARWLQETAFADGLDSGFGSEAFWIIRRLRLEIARLPVFPELLEVTTWCSGKAKSVAERTTTVAGDAGAELRAEAIWVHVDPETRLPARLPEEFERIYGPSAEGRRARASLRHPPEPPAGAERLEWWFGNSAIDLAGHVSNLWYWQPAEEYLDLPTAATEAPVVLEAEFRSGIGHGLATVHRSGQMLWISDSEGTVAGTLAVVGDDG
ncbi:MAG: thioesterase [Solirubrobacterales bacterium]